jgi:aminobenzoyl-glutamate transport protein
MAASAVLLTVVGTLVTEKLVAPRLGEYRGPAVAEPVEALTRDERRGLRLAATGVAAFVLLLAWGVVPEGGWLRNLKTGGVLDSPLLTGVVSFIFAGGLLVGLSYGLGARTIRSEADAVAGMQKAMEAMGGYLVLSFFAAQFVALFSWTNLGLIVTVNGADGLRAMGLQDQKVLLFLAFVTLSAVLDLLIGSASAKWVLMAPVFVPMLMLLGYTPELTQAAYRVGDSVTNVISPTMSYFALILATVQRYDPKAGLGTLIATMLPYTLVLLVSWSLLLVAWIALGLPVGPGAGLRLPG